MNANNFGASLAQKTAQLQQYARAEMPRMASAKILRFIDGNFRAQGYQGQTFQPWKQNLRKGTILVKKGRLRRSFRCQILPDGSVRTFTNTPYAKIHNNGFKGTVTIKQHQRRKYTASKMGTGRFTKTGKERMKTIHTVTSSTQVRTHTRRVNIVRRQMIPTSTQDAPVLMASIKRDIVRSIKQIFN